MAPMALLSNLSQHLGQSLIAYKRDTNDDDSDSKSNNFKFLYIAILIACICISTVSMAFIIHRIRTRRTANEILELARIANRNSQKRLLTIEQVSTLPVLILTDEDIQQSKRLATESTTLSTPKKTLVKDHAALENALPSSQSVSGSSYYSVNEHNVSEGQQHDRSNIIVAESGTLSSEPPEHVKVNIESEALKDTNSPDRTQQSVRSDKKITNSDIEENDTAEKNSTHEPGRTSANIDTKEDNGDGEAENENAVDSENNSKTMLYGENCAVCLEDYSPGDQVRQLPCHHLFHIACIDPWLNMRSATCPMCNFDVAATFPSEEQTTNSSQQ